MRFSLRTLLLSLTVVATSLGAFGPWGLAVAAIVLGVIAAIRTGPHGPSAVVTVMQPSTQFTGE